MHILTHILCNSIRAVLLENLPLSPRFGKPWSLEEGKNHHYVMFEADMHSGPLHTSILDIYKVFEPLACSLKGIWVHPYTVTPAKLAPDLGILGRLWSVKMVPLRHS
jgi:hypothetical protein